METCRDIAISNRSKFTRTPIIIQSFKFINKAIRSHLTYCPNCKENSCTVKIYKAKDYVWSGAKKRVEICINKGCGHKTNLGEIYDEQRLCTNTAI